MVTLRQPQKLGAPSFAQFAKGGMYTARTTMPTGLQRFQQTKQFHFVTFSCYKRQPFLQSAEAKDIIERLLEQTRKQQGLCIAAYVLMPEHIHLLTNEPSKDTLATFLQIFKQLTARELKSPNQKQFWQSRYYDFNVSSEKKYTEKLRISTATPSYGVWSPNPKTIAGAALPTMQPVNPDPSKSSRNGPPAVANASSNKHPDDQVVYIPPFAQNAKDGAPGHRRTVYCGDRIGVDGCERGIVPPQRSTSQNRDMGHPAVLTI